jgi:hypothetical protein
MDLREWSVSASGLVFSSLTPLRLCYFPLYGFLFRLQRVLGCAVTHHRGAYQLPWGFALSRNRGQKKPSLVGLSREPLSVDDKPAARAELLEGTDRSSALVGCALVDSSLVSALTTHFVSMDETQFEELFYSRNAPLQSFSARIQVGRAIGIYGPRVGSMLDSLRKVRNVFAHSIKPLKFDHPLIEKECAKLPDTGLDRLLKNPPSGSAQGL